LELDKTTSAKEYIEITQVKNNKEQEKILTPSYPNFLPIKPQNIELNKGKNKINKYIKIS